jgi:hypothetical protein
MRGVGKCRVCGIKTQAGIDYLQHHGIARTVRADGECAAFHFGLQPVLNAVFHQRLQQ